MTIQNYRLLLHYDGTGYSGWQIQSGLPTIQGTVQSALEKIIGRPVKLIGSGRTDAGVHARGQVANFHSPLSLPPDVWGKAVNRVLPPDIRVLRVSRVAPDFHARRNATSKLYRYQVFTGPIMSPWESRYHLHWPRPIEVQAMQDAAQIILGRHNMQSFAASGTTVRGFEREVFLSEFRRRGHHLVFSIEATGFLQHMVRILVGTLLDVGAGRFSISDFQQILKSRDRTRAGKTAPPQGLFLERVWYRKKP